MPGVLFSIILNGLRASIGLTLAACSYASCYTISQMRDILFLGLLVHICVNNHSSLLKDMLINCVQCTRHIWANGITLHRSAILKAIHVGVGLGLRQANCTGSNTHT